MKNEMLKFIETRKLSTSDVADALGRSGHVSNVLPLGSGHYRAGLVQYLYAWHGSNYVTHRDLEKVEQGSIVFIDGIGCGDKALVGHLMLHYAIGYKKAAAVVVNGNVRDVEQVIGSRMPVWASGRSPIICCKTPTDVWKAQIDSLRIVYEGSIMVCDDTGVSIIMPHQITTETFDSLKRVADREARWYRLLAEGKSTFEITCNVEE